MVLSVLSFPGYNIVSGLWSMELVTIEGIQARDICGMLSMVLQGDLQVVQFSHIDSDLLEARNCWRPKAMNKHKSRKIWSLGVGDQMYGHNNQKSFSSIVLDVRKRMWDSEWWSILEKNVCPSTLSWIVIITVPVKLLYHGYWKWSIYSGFTH